jgi:hypothetical protein
MWLQKKRNHKVFANYCDYKFINGMWILWIIAPWKRSYAWKSSISYWKFETRCKANQTFF